MPEDDFMKSLGYPGTTAKAPAPGSAAAATSVSTTRPGHVPTYDELDLEQKMGQGVAKAGAQAITGLPRATNALIGLVSPRLREGLGNLTERVPGVKRLEAFAASPSEGAAEIAGNLAATGASMFVTPLGARLPGVVNAASLPAKAEGAAAFVPKLAPVVSRMGEVKAAQGDLGRLAEIIGREEPKAAELPEIAKGPIDIPGGAQRTFQAAPPAGFKEEIGKYFGAAMQGAAQGAVSDPNDPLTGAALGSATGGLMPVAGKFFQTKAGQWIAETIGRHGPWVGLDIVAHSFGVPLSLLWQTGIAQFILWHSSPGAKFFGGLGERAAGHVGRALERGSPRIPGAGFGGLENLVEQGGFIPQTDGGPASEVDDAQGG